MLRSLRHCTCRHKAKTITPFGHMFDEKGVKLGRASVEFERTIQDCCYSDQFWKCLKSTFELVWERDRTYMDLPDRKNTTFQQNSTGGQSKLLQVQLQSLQTFARLWYSWWQQYVHCWPACWQQINENDTYPNSSSGNCWQQYPFDLIVCFASKRLPRE